MTSFLPQVAIPSITTLKENSYMLSEGFGSDETTCFMSPLICSVGVTLSKVLCSVPQHVLLPLVPLQRPDRQDTFVSSPHSWENWLE